ncbi:radical SAM protein [Jidongwangia harbinensis]|uniref:radical SAM protein n=1 Tax=Jidongwangia harbinensis TaxID=2878561 RepID=UPI001CD95860|nr:radical SAM protein [Jidongwangia harbinensis]MCA2211328.1 radical SAM protein [Jidongwangia harbinensis]
MIFPITMTCNSKCRSCGIWRLPETAKEHSGADLLTRVAGDEFLRAHVESVNLSGGEPFIHPRIAALTSEMISGYANLREICINTDGHLRPQIEATLEQVLPQCRDRGVKLRVYISLDGLGQAHDRHRRHPGAFERADEALRFLGEATGRWPDTLRVTASFTITDRNADQILPVLHYVRALGVRVDYNLAARPEVFIGGAGLERRFQVTDEQFEIVRSAISEVCRYPESINFSSRFYATMLETLRTGRRSRGCFFPDKGFVLMPDGKTYICGTFLDFYIGDLLTDDFETIWRGARRKSCQDTLIPGKCESCFSNSYEDWDLAVGALV